VSNVRGKYNAICPEQRSQFSADLCIRATRKISLPAI